MMLQKTYKYTWQLCATGAVISLYKVTLLPNRMDPFRGHWACKKLNLEPREELWCKFDPSKQHQPICLF